MKSGTLGTEAILHIRGQRPHLKLVAFTLFLARKTWVHSIPRLGSSVDLKELKSLVRLGQLFAVKEWIAAGKQLTSSEPQRWTACALFVALNTGFHSMVEVLISVNCWTQEELDLALRTAIDNRRLDLVELMLTTKAEPRRMSFFSICGLCNAPMMAKLMKRGANPDRGNGFALGVAESGAPPLIAFYKAHRNEYPTLERQASLALSMAIESRKERLTALLSWAGADPWMRVPSDPRKGWEDLPDYSSETPALQAVESGNPVLVKALKLTPTIEQSQLLLRRGLDYPKSEVFSVVVGAIKKSLPREAQGVLSDFIQEFFIPPDNWRKVSFGAIELSDIAKAGCLEQLLEAGAHWNPERGKVDEMLDLLLANRARYVVRIVRLLLYVPGASSREALIRLASSSSLQSHVKRDDPHLYADLVDREKH